MSEYKILKEFKSSNLTVSIKTKEGKDPSNSDPIFVNIGGVMRKIDKPLSLTSRAKKAKRAEIKAFLHDNKGGVRDITGHSFFLYVNGTMVEFDENDNLISGL